MELSTPSDAPGPGAYENPQGLFERDSYLPSAAFASASEARPDLRTSSAPSGVVYDVAQSDGLGVAATASRTFNHGKTGGFGAAAARKLHAKASDAPGPGEYSSADPNAPTVASSVASHMKASKCTMSGAFASESVRGADAWGWYD